MSAAQSTDPGSRAITIADRYRVLARVGLGGTAVVYRCVDEHTGRIVAAKVLRTTGPQIPEAAGRFRREARLAASLSHRHVVRVLDYGFSKAPATAGHAPWPGDDDQPVPYVAMEYVFGPNLKELVRKYGPLPVDWVWLLGEQLCSALGAAHALGVVHRDVKPQNVMLVDSHIELLAKLTDFGIARQVGGDYTTLTVTGQVLGTPDYLSPEQVMGEPGDPGSDLYALGVVLYELLTGRLPFEADTPLAAASRRMVADPPAPTRYRQDLPMEVQEIILWLLQREPQRRPASANELAEALRWSRTRAPSVPTGPAGAWLVNTREPRAGEASPVQGASSPSRPQGGTPGNAPVSGGSNKSPRTSAAPADGAPGEASSTNDAPVSPPG